MPSGAVSTKVSSVPAASGRIGPFMTVRIFGLAPFAFRKIGVLQGNFLGRSRELLNV
jgi:hypothetical protein